MALKGRHAAAKKDQQARAWLAWQTAMLPNYKKRPDLVDFIGLGKEKPKGKDSVAEIAHTMRRWSVAVAMAQPPARQPRKQR